MVDSKQYFDVVEFLPDDFFRKEKNEPSGKEIMSAILDDTVWMPGNPDNFEPVYFTMAYRLNLHLRLFIAPMGG